MQVERQDRRTVADQNLRVQLVPVTDPVQRLNGETGKILSSRQILKRRPVPMRAAGQQQQDRQEREAHRVYRPLDAAPTEVTTSVSTVSLLSLSIESSVAIVVTIPAVVSTVTLEFENGPLGPFVLY